MKIIANGRIIDGRACLPSFPWSDLDIKALPETTKGKITFIDRLGIYIVDEGDDTGSCWYLVNFDTPDGRKWKEALRNYPRDDQVLLYHDDCGGVYGPPDGPVSLVERECENCVGVGRVVWEPHGHGTDPCPVCKDNVKSGYLYHLERVE